MAGTAARHLPLILLQTPHPLNQHRQMQPLWQSRPIATTASPNIHQLPDAVASKEQSCLKFSLKKMAVPMQFGLRAAVATRSLMRPLLRQQANGVLFPVQSMANQLPCASMYRFPFIYPEADPLLDLISSSGHFLQNLRFFYLFCKDS